MKDDTLITDCNPLKPESMPVNRIEPVKVTDKDIYVNPVYKQLQRREQVAFYKRNGIAVAL
jgi:hypothetical protein